MMQIFFSWWKRMQIWSNRNLDFIMLSETNLLVANTIESILMHYEKSAERIKIILEGKLFVKFGPKAAVTHIFRNEFSQISRMKHPLFTQNEIADYQRRIRNYRFVLTAFVIAETLLYTLTAQFFVSGLTDNEYAQIVINIGMAFSLAFAVMVGLDYSFHQIYRFIEAREKFQEKVIKRAAFNNYLVQLTVSLVIISVSIFTIVSAGMMRVNFLENLLTDGFTETEIAGLRQTSLWASRVTMSITILLGFVMAMMRRDLHEVSVKMEIYKIWRKNYKETNAYIEEAEKLISQIDHFGEFQIHESFELIEDMKKILKRESDTKTTYRQLFDNFMQLLSNGTMHTPEIKSDKTIFDKYYPVRYAHLSLFRFEIDENEKIKSNRIELTTLRSKLNTYKTQYSKLVEEINQLFEPEKSGDSDETTLIEQEVKEVTI